MSKSELDFSIVLAASMHDMKNSLCMLLQSLEILKEQIEPNDAAESEFTKLHYEIARVNSSLLQMLALYRNHSDSLPLHIEEHYIDDLIEDLISKNEFYIQGKGLTIELEIEENLNWYLDSDLVTNLLNDILINALKYTKQRILIKSYRLDNQLAIEIHDDGPGYPVHMIEKSTQQMDSALLSQGKTGLGIYFAHLIAHAHENNGVHGKIHLSNDSQYQGSLFTLTLP